MLQQLQKLDVREKLKDQSGAHCMTVVINFLLKRQQFRMQCFAKEACLQVSCLKYNDCDNTLEIWDAQPDFIITGDHAIAVGEVESSPFVQMIVAALGHISHPLMRFLLGICLLKSRNVELYFIESSLKKKCLRN